MLGDLAREHPEYPELAPAAQALAAAPLPGLAEAGGRPGSVPVLSSFPEPKDPDLVTVLVAWPPAEVVTRRMQQAYAAWLAAQPRTGPAGP
jgi:hypothetical protein